MNLLLILLVISIFAVLLLSIKEIKNQQLISQKPVAKPQDNLIDLNLSKKLLNLVSGDHQVAARLVDNIKQKYPGKTDIWYLEKVINDLENNRR